MDFEGKVALITGGVSGIGLACTKEFLAIGVKGVVIVDINEEGGNKLVKELTVEYENKVVFVKANVLDKSQLRYAFQKVIEVFGNLDIVLNNAGIANEFVATKCYDVNLVGVTNGLQLAMEEFLPKYKSPESDSVIVNVSSICALNPREWYMVPIYCTTKCGILGLTMCYGHEFHYKRTGVKVVAICPGKTITPLSSTPDPLKIEHYEAFVKATDNVPCQEASELAKNLIVILGRASNGSIWKMDGGLIEEVDFPKLC